MRNDLTPTRRTVLSTIGLLGLSALAAGGSPGIARGGDGEGRGFAYTLSNQADGNALIVFRRARDGRLAPADAVATGGRGTGGSLHNQGALAIDPKGRLLFGVNAGSDSISVFELRGGRPRLAQVVPSGGHLPISLTLRDDVLYVLHTGGDDGGTDSIVGFRITDAGLRMLPNSARPLSGPATAPAQVSFTPDGGVLVVTERATDKITTYTVDRRGYAGAPNVQASNGQTPFGFAFTGDGLLLVTEAFGGAGVSKVSLYDVGRDGSLTSRVASLPLGQPSACWVAVTSGSKWAYTSNTSAGTVTGLDLDDRDATLALINHDGATGDLGAGSAPTDSATVGDRLLYVLGRDEGRIAAFGIRDDGTLAPIGATDVFPAGATGLIAR